MNASQLRKMGWHVIFRNGNVYAFKTLQVNPNPKVLMLPVNSGDWMEKADHPGNWQEVPLTDKLRQDFSMAMTMCYCRSLGDGGNCDFCGQVRSAKLAIADSQEAKDGIMIARNLAAKNGKPHLVVWNAYTAKVELVSAPAFTRDETKEALFTVKPDGSFEEGKF